MDLNKNRGVSSQKVAYLCSNSLTPSMVQRSGLLMGREQIGGCGGCHLWSFQEEGGRATCGSGAGLLGVLLGLTLTCFVLLPGP